jgi:hypothetical protein
VTSGAAIEPPVRGIGSVVTCGGTFGEMSRQTRAVAGHASSRITTSTRPDGRSCGQGHEADQLYDEEGEAEGHDRVRLHEGPVNEGLEAAGDEKTNAQVVDGWATDIERIAGGASTDRIPNL